MRRGYENEERINLIFKLRTNQRDLLVRLCPNYCLSCYERKVVAQPKPLHQDKVSRTQALIYFSDSNNGLAIIFLTRTGEGKKESRESV